MSSAVPALPMFASLTINVGPAGTTDVRSFGTHY
jgi:hypothetical protein